MLTRFRYFFFWLWVNHFCSVCVHLMLVYHSVQISHTWSKSWYRKLEFYVTSFWFYLHPLWWNSWNGMLALVLWYVFMVCMFSWCDLFQFTGTEASCVCYIICSQFITFEQVSSSFPPIAPNFLSIYHTLPFMFLNFRNTFQFLFQLINVWILHQKTQLIS